MTCRLCGDHGYRLTGSMTSASAECCTCPAGVAQRIMSNRSAIDAYRLSGSEPVTSVSHAASWDEMESALDTVRPHTRHCCRSCDKALPTDAKCGERCERCEEELAALGRPAAAFDRLDRWVLGFLGSAALLAVLLLIKTMLGG